MEKDVNVAIIGFGTVGSGLVKLFEKNRPRGINLKVIIVKNLNKKRKVAFSNLSSDVKEAIENQGIDIVVELAGGCNPALEYIISSIKNGKHVVTANKAVISEHGMEIFSAAERHNVNIGFEGAVAGAIPIINPLLEQLSFGEIRSITGILNGTTNFILTRMSEGMDYSTALKIAQEKGFAEADPAFDVSGKDAAQKISILASLAFRKWIRPEDVHCEGITEITPTDIGYAKDLGYAVKLLASAKKTSAGDISMKVNPALIRNDHHLAKVNEEFNAILIEGTPFDEYFNVGKGAGEGPTAFSVYYDVLKIADMIRSKKTRKIIFDGPGTKIADHKKVRTEGYLRLYLSHFPGALYNALGVLVRHKWNVKSSIQRGGMDNEVIFDGVKCLPNIITHEPLEFGTIQQTLQELESLETDKGKPVHGKPFYMRIEN